MIQKITKYVEMCSLGDCATENDVENYVGYLTDKLTAEYPDAEINVIAGVGVTRIEADDYDDEEEAAMFMNRCWEEWC